MASVSEQLQPFYLTHSEELLVDRLANSDPSSFRPDSLKKIIKEGDTERLAGMMVADGDLYSGSLEWHLKQFNESGSAKLSVSDTE